MAFVMDEGEFYGWHVHAEEEVRTVKKGKVTFGFADKEITLVDGESIVIPARTRHWARAVEYSIISLKE